MGFAIDLWQNPLDTLFRPRHAVKRNPDAFNHLHVRDDVDHGNGVLGQLVVAKINRPGVCKTRSKVSMSLRS